MIRNLCKSVLSSGGKIVPLIISAKQTGGTGLMNPSIFVDGDKLLLNLRHVNYTLYHCEGEQIFNNRFGPLAYLNPEDDIHLRTINYLCVLNEDLSINHYHKVDTSKLDIPPVWEFIGLEDARLVRWGGKLFMCGVRRDVKTNGEGRMELSDITMTREYARETKRSRIAPPNDPNSYCEKNWMPVIDMPYHFVKWTNPTELVKVNMENNTSKTVVLSSKFVPDMPDFRGGSQVIPWKDYRICIIHEVDLFNNRQKQKDAKYTHRFIVWDKEWNIVKMSDSFSFMNGEIEFCCGMALYKGNFLITFGFQDNAAYILSVPEEVIEEILNGKEPARFDWGRVADNAWFNKIVNHEVFRTKVYEKFFNVESGDVVVDVGASVGPFTYSILEKNPEIVYCLEPSKDFFPDLVSNTRDKNVVCLNKGIADKDGPVIFEGMYNPKSKESQSKPAKGTGIRFRTFLQENGITNIDFLKTDCEGGEYDIFTNGNMEWITSNVRKIAGEWHLSTKELKDKFRQFRNSYLKTFQNFEVYSFDGVNIKWDLWNEHFIEYYKEVTIYIDNRDHVKETKWATAQYPALEITTSIPEKGCPVNCAFCPQKVITKSYNSPKRVMTMLDFKKAINKVPKEIGITFSGFSEPFLNPDCIHMIKYAHSKGHPISLYTTAVGMTVQDVAYLSDIPFSDGPNGGFVLHVQDGLRYAKIKITEQYYEVLEAIKVLSDQIANFRVVSMGPVYPEIRHLFPEPLILRMYSRADNLNKNGTYNSWWGNHDTTCNCAEKLYHAVLLPNGEVTLCCMDYNLNHVLGNLYKQSFEAIMPDRNTPFELCRHCENGITI
jgi:FkbM family methyltransferase